MLTEEKKQDVQELTTILLKLDNTSRTILLSNATVLLARQEVTVENKKKSRNHEKSIKKTGT